MFGSYSYCILAVCYNGGYSKIWCTNLKSSVRNRQGYYILHDIRDHVGLFH